MPSHLESVKGQRLHLKKKPHGQLGFTACVPCPSPWCLQTLGFGRGTWFSTAPGRAFPWENVIVLAGTGSKTSPSSPSVAGCLLVKSRPPKFGFILTFSTSVFSPSILKGKHARQVFLGTMLSATCLCQRLWLNCTVGSPALLR